MSRRLKLVRRPQRSPRFSQQISKPKSLPPEANDWWWNPGRPGVPGGPEWFSRRLKEVDEDLAITENRYTGNYQIWSRKPSLRNPICTGWVLLFMVHPEELDNRVFHRLYEASARKYGSAKEYWRAVEDQIERERRAGERAQRDDTLRRATDYYDYTQIKNIGTGSKFSRYLS